MTANIELTCGANNKTFGICFAKNGAAIPTAHVSAILSDSGEGYGFSLTTLIPTAQNDTISLFVRNETDTTAVTATSLTLSAVGFIR